MDLTKIEGLTEEQIALINEMHNSDTEGLKNKNTELLGKLSNGKSEQESLAQAIEDARQVASKAEEEKLKANNDMEGLRKHYEAQLAEQTAGHKAQAEKATDLIKQRDKQDFMNTVLSKVDDKYRPFAKAMLDSSVAVELNEEGKTHITAKIGDNVFNDAEAFLSEADKSETWQNVLTGYSSNGTGAATKVSGKAASFNNGDEAFLQRLKQSGLTK